MGECGKAVAAPQDVPSTLKFKAVGARKGKLAGKFDDNRESSGKPTPEGGLLNTSGWQHSVGGRQPRGYDIEYGIPVK